MVPLLVGALSGALLSAMLLVGLGAAYTGKRLRDAKKGWNLTPVVVAAVDMEEGTLVSYDSISQRSVPEQFVTASVVKPDSANRVVNQRLRFPVRVGDPLLWTMFQGKEEDLSACMQKLAAERKAGGKAGDGAKATAGQGSP
jgi:pilus assembly protein CpaB